MKSTYWPHTFEQQEQTNQIVLLSDRIKFFLPEAAHLPAFQAAKCCPCHDRDPSRGFDPGHAPCPFPGHVPGHDLGCGVDCCDEMKIWLVSVSLAAPAGPH